MKKTKIAFFEAEDWEKEYLQEKLKDYELSFFADHFDASNAHMADGCAIVSTFTLSQVKGDVLEKLPDLKMVTTRATGFDNIDIAKASERSIAVCNVPTYGENTVAEHTFGLLLNLSRKIYQSIARVREVGFVPDGLRGFDLKGKTIGVIGTGHIGKHVIRIAKGFEMNVLAYDVKEDKEFEKETGFEYVPLAQLLADSDIITLHAPYNEHTHHLINMDNIGSVKRGAYLINTARGGLVETNALVKGLDEGILAGAGLDVLEGEHELKEERELLSKNFSAGVDYKTMLQDHMLMERENVIITPHNAFNSKEAVERILQTTVENIQAFEKGKPINLVN